MYLDKMEIPFLLSILRSKFDTSFPLVEGCDTTLKDYVKSYENRKTAIRIFLKEPKTKRSSKISKRYGKKPTGKLVRTA